MKTILVVFILSPLTISGSAQPDISLPTFFGPVQTFVGISQLPTDARNVSVSLIRRVKKSAALQNKPAIEIILSGSFYVGNLYYCARIGGLGPVIAFDTFDTSGPLIVGRLVVVVSIEDWKKLKTGDPLWLTWGCRQPSEYNSLKPNTFLNKKMLGRNSHR